jgi:ribosome-dependent ATPase
VGSLVLMFVIGFGISMDVEDLSYAVLDRDQTTLSQTTRCNVRLALLSSNAPHQDYATWTGACAAASWRWPSRSARLLPRCWRPAGRDRRLDRRRHAAARRNRAGLCAGHAPAVAGRAGPQRGHLRSQASLETRFRYNPDVKSLPAMVPAVIPLLLMMLPAMLTALVVREKELGSIINLYVTPVTRIEFLLASSCPTSAGDAELPADEPAGGHRVRRAGHRQLPDPGWPP